MQSNSYRPFASVSRHDANDIEAKTPALNFASLHNPYAVAITEDLGNNIFPHPTHTPEIFSQSLHETIATFEGISPENVFVGNGLWHTLQQFFVRLAPRQVIAIGPLAAEYYQILEQLNIPHVQLPLSPSDDFQISPHALQNLWDTSADLVILSTPSTITGTTFASLQAVFAMIRAPRILIDASLQEFLYPTAQYHSQRYTACLQYIRPGTALFMLRGLMPFFACPGLCLAYLLGDKHPLGILKRHAPAYATANYSQRLGERLFQRVDDYRATLPQLAADIITTAMTLRRSDLFEPDHVFEGPSFVCAGLKNPQHISAVVKELHKHHIGLLPIQPNIGLPSGFIRMGAVNKENLPYIDQTLSLLTDNLAGNP